jgi:hypothetical protein
MTENKGLLDTPGDNKSEVSVHRASTLLNEEGEIEAFLASGD